MNYQQFVYANPPFLNATFVMIPNSIESVVEDFNKTELQQATRLLKSSTIRRRERRTKQLAKNANIAASTAAKQQLEITNDKEQFTYICSNKTVSETIPNELIRKLLHRNAALAKKNSPDCGKNVSNITIQVPLNNIITIPAETVAKNPGQFTPVFLTNINKSSSPSVELKDNNYQIGCSICDKLCYEKDLKHIPSNCRTILTSDFPHIDFDKARICNNCLFSKIINSLIDVF